MVGDLAAFGGVVLLAAVTPGPDVAVIVRNAVVHRRAGLAAVAGVLTGLVVHTTAATSGLAAVLSTSRTAFTVLAWAGAVYLAVLGVLALRSALRAAPAASPGGMAEAPRTARRPSHAWRQGLLTNLLNPKTALFFLTLLPQFLPGPGGAARRIGLGVTLLVVAGAWYALVAIVASRAGVVLGRGRGARVAEAAAGVAFVALALRLAVAAV